ncbi:MAG: bifunctional demethylmenaquinone methyltransferase/2-methoxy-6-polyprenyl-1,4-benzoquinol methylase UbiE [Bacteroidetes bacterium]|jgi:demethylmenaquinone methyltransferase/2-methoxy-6-polyprenyl-1,4-benzoquinol methylase|nr:bifunctional demethylmenaquinone methyltransferase/2-methoxy-6-polyprenyl-1,4-benzoquinol methylase UbiE [Bacteroidota bacterium]
MNKSTHIKPYQSEKSKKEQIEAMFDNIAHKYDFLNHFLSLGIDNGWRKKVVKELQPYKPQQIIDIATGTGDLAIAIHKKIPDARITGIDISEKMLDYGRKKISRLQLKRNIDLQIGDAENIDFPDQYFDAATVAFGVRNFENLQKGLDELYRTLRSPGVLVILEFSQPASFPFKQLYNIYFKHILPVMGKLFSKDNSAYTYLPESVQHFPHGKKLADLLHHTGFKKVSIKRLTLGVSSLYVCEK